MLLSGRLTWTFGLSIFENLSNPNAAVPESLQIIQVNVLVTQFKFPIRFNN